MSRDASTGRGSTRWTPLPDKIQPAPQATTQRGRRPHRWFGAYPWPRHEKLSIVVQYRAGAECWYLIEARGRHGVFPGVVSLHAVMREIQQR